MASLGFLLLCALPSIAGPRAVGAQQLGIVRLAVDWLGVSDECASTLNTTVACDDALGNAGNGLLTNIAFLSQEALDNVCVDGCRSSLVALRDTAMDVCADDVIIYTDGIAYPATYMIDKYIYTYDMSCYRNTSNGYCNIEIASWNEAADHGCDECNLAMLSMQLEASVAYDEDRASIFTSLTSSCGSTAYAYETPGAYTITDYAVSMTSGTLATATAQQSVISVQATESASCASSYTIQDGDNCTTIAVARNVSNYNIVYENSLQINCEDLPAAGETICLPETCAIHFLSHSDTCYGIAKTYGITKVQLTTWNTNLDDECRYLERWRGWYLCVGPPGGYSVATATTTTAASLPTNAGTGSNENCAKWHEIISGDTCAQVASDASISLTDFYFLNPEISDDCSNLQLGVSYCVQAVGDISTYSGYATTTPATVFTRPTTTTYSWTQDPTATGTATNCSQYLNYVDMSVLTNAFGAMSGNISLTLNDCTSIAGRYGVTVADLIKWNPTLSADDCQLQDGFSYCVRADDSTTVTITATSSGTESPSTTTSDTPTSLTATSTSTTSAAIPSPTQAGITSDCTAWHLVEEGDGCWAISEEYGITLDDFYSWNSGVGDDCSSLWLGYYVCVGTD